MTRNSAGALWVRLTLVFAALFLFAQGSLMAANQTSTMLDGMVEALNSSAPLGESNPRPDQISKTLLNRKAVTITNPDGTTETFEFFTPVITPDQPPEQTGSINPLPEGSRVVLPPKKENLFPSQNQGATITVTTTVRDANGEIISQIRKSYKELSELPPDSSIFNGIPDQLDIIPQPEQSQQPGSGWQSQKKGDLPPK